MRRCGGMICRLSCQNNIRSSNGRGEPCRDSNCRIWLCKIDASKRSHGCNFAINDDRVLAMLASRQKLSQLSKTIDVTLVAELQCGVAMESTMRSYGFHDY